MKLKVARIGGRSEGNNIPIRIVGKKEFRIVVRGECSHSASATDILHGFFEKWNPMTITKIAHTPYNPTLLQSYFLFSGYKSRITKNATR